MKRINLKTRAQWRAWLTQNHDSSPGIWLVCYKKKTGKATIAYEDVVEEALCFGWIDSIVKKIDDKSFARKLTPRKANSRWSPSNKARVRRLIDRGLMTASGLARVAEAKASGRWDAPDRPKGIFEMPVELQRALEKNGPAKQFFDSLAPSYRKQFIGWVSVAKRPETRARRIKETLALLQQRKKLGMK